MKILGIHDGHSSSAALIEDGQILAAVQEERLTRQKNQGGFPLEAVREVLKIAEIELSDVDHAAFCGHGTFNVKTREDVMASFARKFTPKSKGVLRHLGKHIRSKEANEKKRKQKLQMQQERRMQPLLEMGFPRSKVSFIEHHSCHAATAYFGQDARDEDVLVITNDGAGDGLCATVNVGREASIKRLAEVPQSESIAIIYSFFTYLMGFVPLEHEYKLMGMAPYAWKSGRAREISQYLLSMFRFPSESPLVWERSSARVPDTFQLGPTLKEFVEFKRFDDLAGGLQMFIEEFTIEWISRVIKETGIKKLALSGGLFMNVKLNKLIMEHPDVESLYVFPSCSDESNSIGAAWVAYAKHIGGDSAIPPMGPYYLGDKISNEEIEAALKEFNFRKRVRISKPDDIEHRCAELLAKGEVVARCKGRMEFGARALGNRSILANPDNWKAVRLINDMIKMRDFWMPFAPSMLASDADKYIVNPKGIRAPYMIMAFDTRKEKLDKIIAATHPYDESCRPQVVEKAWNPDYFRLISHFKELTGEAVVLNTSLNLHGSPVVCRAKDALEVFDNSGLHYMALGDKLIEEM